MPAWPANGDTDWNTTSLAYLAVEHETDGTHKVNVRYATVDGSKTKVLTKYLTGTLSAGASENIAHGVTGGLTKILSMTFHAFDDNSNVYGVTEKWQTLAATIGIVVGYNDTNIVIINKGSKVVSNGYRAKIDYIL